MNKKNVILYAKCPLNGECLKCPIGGKAIVYGPFPSRRRGPSLGINLFPYAKTCTFNCIYCFRGKTKIHVSHIGKVKTQVPLRLLRKALNNALESLDVDVKVLDFSGSGEPTLHPRFKDLVLVAKNVAEEFGVGSLGLFTNASLLHLRSVRKALLYLDYIEAKLDTTFNDKFTSINYPCKGVTLDRIINNLISLRKDFDGTLSIQIMLVEIGDLGNFSIDDAYGMANALMKINPDEVHIYTVYRTPWNPNAHIVSEEDMREYSRVLRNSGFNVKTYYK